MRWTDRAFALSTGVVYGWSEQCEMDEDWLRKNNALDKKGHPFYNLLCDSTPPPYSICAANLPPYAPRCYCLLCKVFYASTPTPPVPPILVGAQPPPHYPLVLTRFALSHTTPDLPSQPTTFRTKSYPPAISVAEVSEHSKGGLCLLADTSDFGLRPTCAKCRQRREVPVRVAAHAQASGRPVGVPPISVPGRSQHSQVCVQLETPPDICLWVCWVRSGERGVSGADGERGGGHGYEGGGRGVRIEG
eukprot:336579-Rhodomonas_salina.3